MKSGFFCLFIGVGTVTIITSQSFRSSKLLVNFILDSLILDHISFVESIPFFKSVIFFSDISNQTISIPALSKLYANGKPTYHNHTTAIFIMFFLQI